MPTQWYYAQNGQRFGPFDLTQLKQLADAGLLARTDLVWQEGSQGWVTAGSVPEVYPVLNANIPTIPVRANAVPPPLPAAYTAPAPVMNRVQEWEKIKQIAIRQRHVMIAFCSYFAFGCLLGMTGFWDKPESWLFVLSAVSIWAWLMFRLGDAMGMDMLKYVFAATAIIPGVGAIALLVLDHIAGIYLRQIGLKVGLFGAESLPEQPPPWFKPDLPG